MLKMKNIMVATVKHKIKRIEGNIFWLFALLIGIFAVASLTNPKSFLTLLNFQSMCYQFPEYGIMALGMMICMIAGGIDLSTVGVANLTGIVAAVVITSTGTAAPLLIVAGILVALIVGTICGAINGFLIGFMRIPAMLVTLCGLQIYSGLGLAITKGPAITGLPESYQQIGNGLILNTIPIVLVLFIVIVALMWFIMKYTKFGLQMVMVGANPTAARYSGINNFGVIMKTHILSSVLATVSGIIISAHYGSAKSDYGASYTLLTLLIVILGGVNPNGGKGRIGGVVIAILILQILSSVFNIQRLDPNLKTFVFGWILAIVMIFEYWKVADIRKHTRNMKRAKEKCYEKDYQQTGKFH